MSIKKYKLVYKRSNIMKVHMTYKGKFATPTKQTAGAAGLDLFNNSDKEVVISSKGTGIIETGVCVEIPETFVGLLFPRSSLGFKRNTTLANSVGVIDSDFRGEIKAKLTNHSEEEIIIAPGERVCQLVIVPILNAEYKVVEELSETERGANGYGSTGEI